MRRGDSDGVEIEDYFANIETHGIIKMLDGKLNRRNSNGKLKANPYFVIKMKTKNSI
jgi:hypothetical protein